MSRSTIFLGDSLSVLRTLPPRSVHCAITSPPYWRLRDYGVAGQIGLEPTLQDWLAQLVAVFEEVRRVLRPDGTLWLNVGDAYSGTGSGAQGESGVMAGRSVTGARPGKHLYVEEARPARRTFLRPKQRMGLPHRLVFALQDAGWWWRDEIVWHKRSPMPEACRDRCTMAHEFLFLLSPRPSYYYDAEAIREDVSGGAHLRRAVTPTGWDTGPGNHDKRAGHYERRGERSAALGGGAGHRDLTPKAENMDDVLVDLVSTKNRRSVWSIAAEPTSEAHFATFPTKLVEPCVRAGTSEHGVCPSCGAPWRRVVEKGEVNAAHQQACGADANGEYRGEAQKDFGSALAENASDVKRRILAGLRDRKTVGWVATCRKRCKGGAPVSPVVLDPFCGSGTTGLVALQQGREFIGIELNPDYAEIARKRVATAAPLFCPRPEVVPFTTTEPPKREA